MQIEKEKIRAHSAWLDLAYKQIVAEFPQYDIHTIPEHGGPDETTAFCAQMLIDDHFAVSDSHNNSRIISLTGIIEDSQTPG